MDCLDFGFGVASDAPSTDAASASDAARATDSSSSTGGYPALSGLSLIPRTSTKPTTVPMMPGAHMPHCHPSAEAALPARRGAVKPPRLCATFHMPQYVPLSLVGNHEVRMRAQHGPPTPCRMP